MYTLIRLPSKELFAKRIATRLGRPASPEWFVYLALFFMTVLARVAYIIVLRPAFDGTQWDIAETLLQSGVLGLDGLKTTSCEPAYPLFLSLARLVSRDNIRIIQTLQAAIDSIGAVYLYRVAKHLSGRERTAVFSAMLYALYPLLIRHAVIASSFSCFPRS